VHPTSSLPPQRDFLGSKTKAVFRADRKQPSDAIATVALPKDSRRPTDGYPVVSSIETVLIYRFDELWRNDMPGDGPGSTNVTAAIALGEK